MYAHLRKKKMLLNRHALVAYNVARDIPDSFKRIWKLTHLQ